MSLLLNIEEIAELNKCSLRHARDVIVKLAGFPKEAPTSTPRNRLWIESEVLAFVSRSAWGTSIIEMQEYLDQQREITQQSRNSLASC